MLILGIKQSKNVENMKKLLILFSLIIANTALLAQNDYYWYKNQKVFLKKISTKKYLTVENIEDTIVLKQKLNIPDVKVHKFSNTKIFSSIKAYKQNVKNEKKWAVVESQNIGNVVLTAKNEIIYENPFYYTLEEKEVGISHLFYVKLFKDDDVENLEVLAQQNNVEILGNNRFMPLWFTLSCSKHSAGNALKMANLFYESGLFVASEPDLMVDILTGCVDDPHFNNQWGLENTGQNGGTVGADINACQAWQTTTGSNNIVVAVLDDGIELDHPDMPNIHPASFDTESGTSPSQVLGNHGTACAGIIGASSDNNLGVAGIAPNCPLMSISNDLFLSVDISQQLANGFNFAWQNGASVISNSWGHGALTSTLLDDAIDNALTQGRNGLGCVVVLITQNWNNPSVVYPANSNPDIIAVGALSPCEERKSPSSCDGEGWGSNYGTELDIMAPGVLIPTTDRQGTNGYNNSSGASGDYYQTFNGTSSACPHVAAVAGLILSVNHNLTQKEVADIIETTAQKMGTYSYQTTVDRPNGTWHNEMGYGVVDADAAVLQAQSLCTSTQLDLFSKDWHDDFGLEPYAGTGLIYLSNDIWVRNQPDGIANQTSQNPECSPTNDPNQLNYVYVRVRNKGCVASSGTETLDLRWAKASTALSWPTNWNGTLDLDPPNNAIAGDSISTQTIPVIPAGGESILEFTWNPPCPSVYSFNPEPWHFCLLSRILAANDPMAVTETSDLGANVRNNNNIAWKNLAVVDNIAGFVDNGNCPAELINGIGVAVAVRNPDDKSSTFDIKFSVPKEELANPITKEGNVMIALDDQLYENWVKGGKKGTGFTEIKSPNMSQNGVDNNNINSNSPLVVSNRKMFEITGTSTSFNNITLDAGELRITSMMVLYPSDPVSDKQRFKYDIIQKRTENGQFVGGVRYDIKKPTNNDPPTDAGNNRTIKRGCSTTLTASPLKDCYIYFWLNEQGNIISQDASITVSPNTTTTYTLKIVSSEGFVSVDDITVTVSNQLCQKEREIIRITPNPAKERVTVKYKAENTNNAHLRLVKTDNSIDRIYNLDLQITQITLDISDCTFGSYVITLVCDGINEDGKTLIIH